MWLLGLVERPWSTVRRGISPPFILLKGDKMAEKVLSVFIDESGDFGMYDVHTPYYLVSLVFHDQSVEISNNIKGMEMHLKNLGYPNHAVHTGPLIRRESIYRNDLVESRKKLFNALFNFARKLEFSYSCTLLKKKECDGIVSMLNKQSQLISDELRRNQEYLASFDKILVYYDNGQNELSKILTSVFNSLFSHVEFRKVKPVEYKLFQVADLICTMELLAKKADNNLFSRSENEFFGGVRNFKKNYYKWIRKKCINKYIRC